MGFDSLVDGVSTLLCEQNNGLLGLKTHGFYPSAVQAASIRVVCHTVYELACMSLWTRLAYCGEFKI